MVVVGSGGVGCYALVSICVCVSEWEDVALCVRVCVRMTSLL